MDHLVLTVIAADKPGVVERVAHCIAERSGLVSALEDLSTHGIRVLVGESSGAQASASKPILMTLVGNDRPGIVREITALLSQQGVNLERLSTDVLPAPMSGDPLFNAEALLQVPATLSLETLQEALETLADDLMVELRQEE